MTVNLRGTFLSMQGKGIRINAVCPDQIDMPMNAWLTDGDTARSDAMVEQTQPIGRIGQLEEIADAVLWPASAGRPSQSASGFPSMAASRSCERTKEIMATCGPGCAGTASRGKAVSPHSRT